MVGGSDRLQTTGVYRAGYGIHTTPGIAVLISYLLYYACIHTFYARGNVGLQHYGVCIGYTRLVCEINIVYN